MSLISIFYKTILEALFPISEAERRILSLTPEQAYNLLPSAPSSPIPDTYSVFSYKDDRVSKMVWNIKYKKSKPAVSIGSYALYKKLIEMSLPSNSVIIPIPITNRRKNERGYNQCELLMDAVRDLDAEKIFTFRKDILLRRQHTSRQTLKGRQERLADAKGIFSLNPDDLGTLKDKTIVIIDDVITTGSTINEAMKTVRRGGCQKVYGLSLAH